jgi:hypothetical protein
MAHESSHPGWSNPRAPRGRRRWNLFDMATDHSPIHAARDVCQDASIQRITAQQPHPTRRSRSGHAAWRAHASRPSHVPCVSRDTNVSP